MRHNLRHAEQLVTPYDLLILDHLQPGVTVAWELIGNQYRHLIENINIDQDCECANVIAANATFFKYQTLAEIGQRLQALGSRLQPGGRIFAGWNLQFVNFNRLSTNYYENQDRMLADLPYTVLRRIVKGARETNPYGNNFFILEKQ